MLALSACDQQPNGTVTVSEDAKTFFAIVGWASMGAGFAGSLFGIEALTQFADAAGYISKFGSVLEAAIPVWNAIVATPAEAAPPGSMPKPVLRRTTAPGPPSDDFSRVAFFGNSVSFNLTVQNTSNTDGLAYNVYGLVRAVGDPPPNTADDFLRSDAIKSFVAAMDRGQSFTQAEPFNLDANQGYVLYSLAVPSSLGQLTDEIVRTGIMVGPVIYCYDTSDQALREQITQRADWKDQSPIIQYQIPAIA